MTYGKEKDICIYKKDDNGILFEVDLPYWDAMPKMRPTRYPDMEDCWILEEDFYLRIKNRMIIIKKTFDFDGGSVPKYVWSIIGHPMQMWLLLAALAHDSFYASNLLPQSECDWLFLELLQACDRATPIDASWAVPRLAEENHRWRRRNECYTAVKAFGRFVYSKHDEDLEKYCKLVSLEELPEVLEPLLS